MDEKKNLFESGQLVSTRGAIREFTQPEAFELLTRHFNGDWGDLDDFDKEQNDIALKGGGRLLSAYEFPPDRKLWIITEADRSVTTMLLPEEY